MKKSFVLISTLILLILFSIFTISLVETNIFNTNINKLKYLHLQAQIHLRNIKLYLISHPKSDINNIIFLDSRFDISIKKTTINKKTIFHIFISTKDNTPITIVDSISL